MRARSARTLALLLAAVTASLLASSCSRDLPTAPLRSTAVRAHVTRFTGTMDANEVAVTLAPGVDAATVAASYGATLLHFDPAQGVASMTIGAGVDVGGLLPLMASDPRITSSESNVFLQTSESRQKSFAFDDGLGTPATFVAQPAASALRLADAHTVATGSGVKVAILDTGIDPDHPAFAGHIAGAYDFVLEQPGATDIAGGVDSNGDGVPDGAWGHGTHVAGIVMLTAPDAQLLVGRVLDSDGVGDVVTVAAGIRWAVSQGADVINLSLGALQTSTAIAHAIDEAHEHGVIVVTSAGNWGNELPHEYPASDPNALAIAASDAYGSPAPWTSYAGYVRLSAPGVAIRSAYPGGGYRLWSGTSMAAPFVSGTAAMLLQLHPSWTSSRLMTRLAGAAAPLANLAPIYTGMLGAGMLDAGASLAPDAPDTSGLTPIEAMAGSH